MRRVVILAGLLAACGDNQDPCAERRPGLVCEVAGSGRSGWSGDGKRPDQTDFYLVSQVRRGPDGRVYLMDSNNYRLRVIDDSGAVATLAGNGEHAYAMTGVPALESPLESPFDFDFLPSGEPVFVSAHDPRVLRLGDDGALHTMAGTGIQGDSGDGGSALDARFTQAEGIAVGADGSIVISDDQAHRVRLISSAGLIVTLAGTGAPGYAGDGGPSTAAALDTPEGLAIDRDGNVYVADTGNHVVRKIDPAGTITTFAGSGTAGDAGDGGPARAARFEAPDGLAVGEDGSLYVADQQAHRIRRVRPDGVIEAIAGTGHDGFSGNGGLALAADFAWITRLSVSGDELFVAEYTNSCARVVYLEP